MQTSDDGLPRSLVVVGAGGLGVEVAEAVRAINAAEPTWDLLGFLDDAESSPASVAGVPVLGPTSELAQLPEAMTVVCVGSPARNWTRKQVVTRLDLPPSRYATIVHPTAVIPPAARIGPGSIVLASVVATTAVQIGAHVVVMPGTIFTHDDVIADYATFGAGVRLAGGVSVDEGAYLGAGALVREYASVGAWALVGMGAVVIDDVPPGEIWAGTPARLLRPLAVPADVRGR